VIVYYIVKTSDGVFTKYFFTVFLSFLVTMAIYHLFVRPFAVMRFLFGMKPKKKVEEKVVESISDFRSGVSDSEIVHLKSKIII
jgi:hypothetical protein